MRIFLSFFFFFEMKIRIESVESRRDENVTVLCERLKLTKKNKDKKYVHDYQ